MPKRIGEGFVSKEETGRRCGKIEENASRFSEHGGGFCVRLIKGLLLGGVDGDAGWRSSVLSLGYDAIFVLAATLDHSRGRKVRQGKEINRSHSITLTIYLSSHPVLCFSPILEVVWTSSF